MGKIYGIIKFSCVRKYSIIWDILVYKKGEWIYILKKKIRYYTKEILKYFNMIMIAFSLILAIVLMKYKPMYKVSISGSEKGYIQNKEALEEKVKESIFQKEEKNIDTISIKTEPQYELKFVDKTVETKEEEVIANMEQDLDIAITYKYYAIALNNETMDLVDTLEEAEEIINKVKEESQEKSLDLSIIEKYTEKEEEIQTSDLEVAKKDIQTKIAQTITKQQKQK